MRILLALGLAMFSFSAQASYLENCQFTATVEEMHSAPTLNKTVSNYTQLATLAIVVAEDQGSHVPGACQRHVGEPKVLVVDYEDMSIEAGDHVIIEYSYVSGLSAAGYTFNESWKVLKKL